LSFCGRVCLNCNVRPNHVHNHITKSCYKSCLMRIAYRLITICGVGLFLSVWPFAVVQTLLQMTVMLACSIGLLFALITTLIIGLASWRKSSRWWMGPALLCVAFILGFITYPRIGVADWWFKRHMAPYAKIVDSIQSGAIPPSTTIADVNVTNLPPYIRNVRAARCPDGSVLVVFFSKACSYAGHSGCLFKDYTETNSCVADYTKYEQIWHLRHITGNWYKLSD